MRSNIQHRTSNIEHRRRAVFSLVGVCLLLASCAEREGEAPGKDEGVRRKFERGPVKVVLTLDRKEPTIADRINLTIDVTADEDYEVQLPRFGDKLEQFGIVDYHTSQPVLVGENKTRVTRSYVLEPFLSGEYVIPGMKIGFTKKGEKEPEQHEIETEEITISVKSLLPGNLEDLKVREIAGPVALPRAALPWMWGVGVLVITAGTVLVLILVRRQRRRKQDAVAAIPPHEIAFRELAELVAQDLMKNGQIKLFYRRVSSILRTYIENRFGLRAPEQTTQEFLLSIGMSKALQAEHQPLLERFLNHCDMVKFAELQPTTKEIQNTFDSCKDFIVATKEEQETGLREV